ncbi:nucleotide pyrophosphohydrolase [soil metagenome]
MEDISKLREIIVKFREERDWKQFHNPKDLAISMMLEAGEVLEHFEWMNKEEQWKKVESHKEEISEELADVFSYLLLLCNDLDIDLSDAFIKKLEKSSKKYPVDKAKGNHTKYTEL